MFSWIKASERLPENADRVLALRKGFNKKYYWAVTAQYLYKFNALSPICLRAFCPEHTNERRLYE